MTKPTRSECALCCNCAAPYCVRCALQDEIHVEVRDENVLRFGHNPRAEREKEDLEEPGVFHRAERVGCSRPSVEPTCAAYPR